MKSNVEVFEIPETKKAVYYQIKSRLFEDYYEHKGLYAVIGPRRVGKTTLLQQLCQEYDGYYFSIEELNCTYNEYGNSKGVLDQVLDVLMSKEKLVCIDEITQLPKDVYGALSHYLKLVNDKIVIVAGSIPKSTKDFCRMAGVKRCFSISSLSYWEYCNWNRCKVSEDSYKSYLKFKQFEELENVKDYAVMVLQGSCNSFKSKEIEYEEMNEDVEDILRTGRISSPSKRQSLEKFLSYTGLGKKYSIYEMAERDGNYLYSPLQNVISNDSFMHFEFPCFGNIVYSATLLDDELSYNQLCEVDVFNQLIKLFHDCGKFRSNDELEIDFMSAKLLVEIKNSKVKYVKRHLGDYLKIANRVKVPRLLLTTSEEILEKIDVTGTEVLIVNLPQLCYTLGETACDCDSASKVCANPIEFIQQRLQRTFFTEQEDITNL